MVRNRGEGQKRTMARGLLLVVATLLVGAAPASAAIVINEVESDGVADFVELTNTGAAPVDLGGYVVKDNNDGNTFTIAGGTMVVPGGFYVANVAFGLGSADAARLFSPGAVLLDSYAWTAHAAATYGRCPDGTGAMISTTAATPGAPNSCPAAAATWPGDAAVSLADDANVFGANLSGLAYQPSGSAAKGVLWAVRNGPSTLYRLIYDGTRWTPDTANGWANGKTLVYPDGGGVPDAEGVTLAGGDDGAVFVSVERNDSGGVNSTTSRPGVLRFDTAGAGTTLTATREFDLTADLPGLPANAGLEAVAWVPDSLLTSKGFRDEATGTTYDPVFYPNHGAGLFFVGVEDDGRIIAYALNQGNGAFTRVATIASGFPKLMDLSYDPETTHLWAVCDDSCDGRTATLDVAAGGAFAVSATYERPGGMANLNNEGFAIAPRAECSSGRKPVFWADDSNDAGHALRTGTLACTDPAVATPPGPDSDPGQGPGPGPGTGPGPSTPLGPAPIPGPTLDRTAPSLKIALRLARTGTYAIRRSGRLALVMTLGERADLTLTATARRSTHARARTILKATRRGVAAGKRTLTLSVTRRVRAALRKGETITLTVVARDAARNATTKRATAKVR
jgi:hypothetical protein